ncbi:hypothetical protein AVEN_261229-1 [Araneus ventricosus]|uniref:Uncharacterized protein n=1 Tax=Araneus ventricosus TaxID=182803 RepID=A0A4Y2GJS3_ARAVE|nr:hypothetical protein AVEN_261229-1 [Araneus ventricosus]
MNRRDDVAEHESNDDAGPEEKPQSTQEALQATRTLRKSGQCRLLTSIVHMKGLDPTTPPALHTQEFSRSPKYRLALMEKYANRRTEEFHNKTVFYGGVKRQRPSILS